MNLFVQTAISVEQDVHQFIECQAQKIERKLGINNFALARFFSILCPLPMIISLAFFKPSYPYLAVIMATLSPLVIKWDFGVAKSAENYCFNTQDGNVRRNYLKFADCLPRIIFSTMLFLATIFSGDMWFFWIYLRVITLYLVSFTPVAKPPEGLGNHLPSPSPS